MLSVLWRTHGFHFIHFNGLLTVTRGLKGVTTLLVRPAMIHQAVAAMQGQVSVRWFQDSGSQMQVELILQIPRH